MYRQYLEIKGEYPDALLFYRMGDFFELFFEDAKIASRELQLALTSRSRDEGAVPMCGVPWHSAESYISQLIDKGYKIAVCDQIEDPRQAKGLVKRAVTRVVTRGTALEDSNLSSKEHNYLGAFLWSMEAGQGGLAWLDASTGFWTGLQSSREEELVQWALKMRPREFLVADNAGFSLPAGSAEDIQVVRVPYQGYFEPRRAAQRVLAAQHVAESHALGLEKSPQLMQACGALVAYLEQTQKRDPEQLAPFVPLDRSKYLVLDEVTEKNLELFRRTDGRRGQGTLWAAMDHTLTPMGGRMLEERLRCPWRQPEVIASVQDAVQFLVERDDVRRALRTALDAVQDIERLSTRIALNRCLPHDFAALRASLAALPAVRAALLLPSDPGRLPTEDERGGSALPDALRRAVRRWDAMEDVCGLLQQALKDQLPAQITDGGLFRSGYDAELDRLLDMEENGTSMLKGLLSEEQEKCGLPKLKLGFNHVFGYYFELSRAQQTKPLPEYFERRQSLANSERYTTQRLRELEEEILSASEKRKSLEYRLYQELREKVAREKARLAFMAEVLAHADYWQSLAEGASRNGWTRPVLNSGNGLRIRQGRHPVVEAAVGRAAFIPNDLVMDAERRLILVTGPNMAGKSTVLRQTAIICIMAQMGSFVPAEEAEIGIADRIFSRVGASDNLAQGQSTFMVELMETAR
ncbi:MAG: DNA mismatch repair protein MutS, partial [Mailhella sp.]|nr:DNA mismatch repair protein MutS [Mailhella sp.]